MTLITTLVPAYKKQYLDQVLLGLQRQTCRDFEVILSDDSPGDEITALIRAGHFGPLTDGLNLRVVRGPKNGRLNHEALLAHWNHRTPFVHLQLDDDVVFPDFYRQHLLAHALMPCSVSVSRRWITDLDTLPVQGTEQPDFVANRPERVVHVQAPALFRSTIPKCENWLGEFSNMLLSADSVAAWPRPPAEGLNYFGWMDVGYLLCAVQQRPIAVIRDHLSLFRRHPAQSTVNFHNHSGRVASLAWAVYAMQAWREERITYKEAVEAVSRTVRSCFERHGESDPTINEFYAIVQHQGTDLVRLTEAFTPFWHRLLRSHPSTAPDEAAAPADAVAG